jgi:hypothetical protein
VGSCAARLGTAGPRVRHFHHGPRRAALTLGAVALGMPTVTEVFAPLH